MFTLSTKFCDSYHLKHVLLLYRQVGSLPLFWLFFLLPFVTAPQQVPLYLSLLLPVVHSVAEEGIEEDMSADTVRLVVQSTIVESYSSNGKCGHGKAEVGWCGSAALLRRRFR